MPKAKRRPPVTQYINKAHAREMLDASEPTIDALIQSGRLPAYRFGPRSVRIKVADVEALLEPVVPRGHADTLVEEAGTS